MHHLDEVLTFMKRLDELHNFNTFNLWNELYMYSISIQLMRLLVVTKTKEIVQFQYWKVKILS